MNAVNRIISKLTSGKFILTITCAGIFVYAVVYRVLSPEAIGIVIALVFKSYFEKGTNKKEI